MVIMGYPGGKETLHMGCCQWDHKVQALPPQCAQQPFAEGIGLGRLRRRFQDP